MENSETYPACHFRSFQDKSILANSNMVSIITRQKYEITSNYIVDPKSELYLQNFKGASYSNAESNIYTPEFCAPANHFTVDKKYAVNQDSIVNVQPAASDSDSNTLKFEILEVDSGLKFEFYMPVQHGAAYTLFLDKNQKVFYEQTFTENVISVWVLLPQIICLAISEILVSTTSYEYAYRTARISSQTISMNCVISMLSFGSLIKLMVSFEPEIFGHFYVSDFAWYVTWGGCMCFSIVKLVVFGIRNVNSEV